MSTRMNLAHVLADLGSTYNSIDVRTAAYRIEGTWYSLITVIRFSELDERRLDENTNAGWRRLKSVTHERLRIERKTFRYEDRDELFQSFIRGVAEFADLQVQLGRPWTFFLTWATFNHAPSETRSAIGPIRDRNGAPDFCADAHGATTRQELPCRWDQIRLTIWIPMRTR